MISLPPVKLKEILTREGIIDSAKFDALFEEATRKRQNVVDLLISQNLLNEGLYLSLISKALGVTRVDFGETPIDESALRLLSEDVARQRKAIVFGRDASGFSVAMEDPTDLETINFLALKLGGSVKPFLVNDADLNRGLSLYEKQLTQDFKQVIEESIRESVRLKVKGDIKEAASDLPIVGLVNNLLAYAISSRASDVHFEALDDGVLVRYRIDGVLHEVVRMPKDIHPAVVARIKILSNLRVDEHIHPQDGRFRNKMGTAAVDIRVSMIPTFYGEKIVLRLLTAAALPLSFTELGMFDDTASIVREAISRTYGMTLACGPTGSGKTTLLYAMINILNRPEVNIVTIEDPIEYDMRYVNQMQVNVTAGITFANGLRSILRQDPNIVLVGEIRDSETAAIAIQAALTGHLVLSSLHTNDAPTAIPRFIDMGVPPFLIAAVLNTVSSQRLARRIHVECIESYTPEADLLDGLRVSLGRSEGTVPSLPKSFYRGRGCSACNNTGYLGRVGIFEVMRISERVRKLIISREFSLDTLRKTAREEGMITLVGDGLRKAQLGLTTIEEVLRVIRE